VRVVATPAALVFIDAAALERHSGSPVRSDFADPRQPRTRSRDDAIIVAPATFNTINKLAVGVNDTYALTVVAEGIGRQSPVVVLPFVNTALAARRPFTSAVESLRGEGVHVILGPSQWMPHPPGTGDQRIKDYPWQATLDALKLNGVAAS
jgi:phosphopantothenoylcysteine synthetase/decarboxylase